MKKLKKCIWVILTIGIVMLISYNLIFQIHTTNDYKMAFYRDKSKFENMLHNLQNDQNMMNGMYRGKRVYLSYGMNPSMVCKYGFTSLEIRSTEDLSYILFNFDDSIQGYQYSGIYYVSDDVPKFWSETQEYEIIDGVYIQDNYSYRYETQKLADNWYYFQCHFYHGL